MCSLDNYHIDETLLGVGNELGGKDVIIKIVPNGRVDREMKTGVEGSLVKNHLARTSESYSLILLG